MNISYKAILNDDNQLLKNVVKKKLSLSNRLFNKLKLSHNIYINNDVAFANDVIHKGDIITVDLDYEEEDNIKAQKHPIEVLYEDDWYIAVNKPADIVVHPCSYHPDNTLANYLKFYLNKKKKIRPVNRLDKGTSGIVLFAKNEYAQELFNEMDSKDICKEYLAIIYGTLEKKHGCINLPIARKQGSIIERQVDFDDGQVAITEYKVEKEFKVNEVELTLVRVRLKTGRTHQIRVHFSYIGHPLLGDSLYNKKEPLSIIDRQALQSVKLEFKHPITNKQIMIECKIDDALLAIINNY